MRKWMIVGAFALAAGLAVGGRAAAEDGGTKFWFGTATKHTNIAFVSEAEIETINGMCHEMSGSCALDFEALSGSCALTIPVASLQTGIPTRDEHLRSDAWLDAEKHPDITLTSDAITLKAKDAAKGLYTATLKAKLTIHGVTKERELTADVLKLPEAVARKVGDGEWVRVTSKFDVKLGDHDVKIPNPETVGPKVSETWSISFSAFATTTPPKKR